MMTVASIVEGDGEVAALPILLRRLAAEWQPCAVVDVLTPIRVKRDRFLNKDEEFGRQLQLAAAKSAPDGWILILLDADDDCPAERSRELLEKAGQCVGRRRVSVVFANREFEAWFIAGADSLEGVRGFSNANCGAVDAEKPRDAKGWLRERMDRTKYSEILDQPAFTAKMNLHTVYEKSRSFRKLCSEWQSQLHERDDG